MSSGAKTSIAKVAAILAPHQKNKINVNGYTDSTPIGPELMQQGITTNLILSQKRADRPANFRKATRSRLTNADTRMTVMDEATFILAD
jgi:flagellar motor protein MotB